MHEMCILNSDLKIIQKKEIESLLTLMTKWMKEQQHGDMIYTCIMKLGLNKVT